ncbi:hypothetical protein [Rufibacter immobilis]|uniref:hypothetical protein n=1 Tax=Rufibacter immobilis TaxID=1348778 RepID=UPI0035E84109
MRKILLFAFLLTSLVATSCGDEEITRDPDAIGYQYYPLEVGNYWIFNVTENTYRRNEVENTTSYQTRERIDAITKDQEGREWYRVELSRRSTEGSNWVINGVRLISRSASDLRVQENNSTYVRMVYPVEEGRSFITNAFLGGGSETKVYLTYQDLGKPYAEDGLDYATTLTVKQADFEEFLDKKEATEVLAWGVGPIKRSTINYDYCNPASGESDCAVGTNFIVSGTDKTELLVSSGKAE